MFKSIQQGNKVGNLSLQELSSQEENQKCIECDQTPANWVSVNNGIFLCYDCANEHKGFGSLISTIKSTELDICYLKLLRAGGNFRFKVFLETYGFPSNISKKELYSSKLINFYRKKLKADSNEEYFNDSLPPKQQFWEPYTDSIVPTFINNDLSTGANETQVKQNEGEPSLIPSFISSGATSIWGSVWGATTNVASAVKNKLNEIEVGSKILTVGGNTLDAITTTGSKAYKKGSEVISTHGGKTLELLNQTGSKMMEKGSELYAVGKEKTVAGITYASGQIYEKGAEIVQGQVVQNLKTQAGESMIYIKDKIVNAVQESSQNKPSPNPNSSYSAL